jgi:hypothetical protein
MSTRVYLTEPTINLLEHAEGALTMAIGRKALDEKQLSYCKDVLATIVEYRKTIKLKEDWVRV